MRAWVRRATALVFFVARRERHALHSDVMWQRRCLTVVVCLIAIAASGCAWVRGACGSALPGITKAQSYSHDGALALDQAEAAFERAQLPPDVQKRASEAISAARTELQAVNTGLRAASDACSQIDAVASFVAFERAWTPVENLLALQSDKLGASAGPTKVHTPAIVVEARRLGLM